MEINNSNLATILSIILKYSPSEGEVSRNLNMIKLFLEQYYFVEGREKNFAGTLERVKDLENVTENDLKLLTEIFEEHSHYFTRETFYEALDGVAKQIYSLPKLVLQLPVRLDIENLQRIAEWVRTNVGQNVLLTIRVNPLLLVGCGIGWDSRYTEFSLDEKIQAKKAYLFSLLPKL